MTMEKALEGSRNISDIFDLVKKAVRETIKRDGAGLMLGVSDLGIHPQATLGAYYSPAANMIVVNRSVLKKIKQKSPGTYKSYLFFILLHEYLHSVGVYDEKQTRLLTYEIANRNFGENHQITHIAKDFGEYLKKSLGIQDMYVEPKDGLDFVLGFNKSDLNYIG